MVDPKEILRIEGNVASIAFQDYLTRYGSDLLAGEFRKQFMEPVGSGRCVIVQKGNEFRMAGGNAGVACVTEPDHRAEDVSSPKTFGNAGSLGGRKTIVDNKDFERAEDLVLKALKAVP